MLALPLLNLLVFWVYVNIDSILLTYIFHKKLRGTKFFRVMLYLPSIICSVVLVGIFEAFVSGKGVLGRILTEYFGGALIAMLPILLIFIFFADKLMGQMYVGGLKG